jgi:hypothetical protein
VTRPFLRLYGRSVTRRPGRPEMADGPPTWLTEVSLSNSIGASRRRNSRRAVRRAMGSEVSTGIWCPLGALSIRYMTICCALSSPPGP